MSPGTKLTGSVAALMLAAALLAACARADVVTWKQCNITGMRQLTRGDWDNEATKIDISLCKINAVNEDDLKGLSRLTNILLYGNDIRHLDTAVFHSVPEVTSLNLDSNNLSAMPVFSAESLLPNLVYLYLIANRISKLDDPKTFSSTKKLQWLWLEQNDIQYIHPDVFLGLPELSYIILLSNKLTYIASTTFAIPSLTYLNLGSNSIEFVAPGAFDGSSLEMLSLDNNRLTHLPEDFFTGAGGRLQFFCFYNNPWRCSYLLKQVNITKVKCREDRPNFSDGTEPVCFYAEQ